MLTIRRLRPALILAGTAGVFALAFLGAPSDASSAAVVAQSSPAPKPSGSASLPVGVPTPYPISTLPPAGESTVPYPAYGTPVPGAVGVTPPPETGIPYKISLSQAQAVGFAKSPLLVTARADVGVAAAEVRIAAVGLNPDLYGTATVSRTIQQAGSLGTTGDNTNSRAGEGNFTDASFGATLTQLIYDGGKLAAGVKSAQRNESANRDTYLRELQTVAENVAVAYYNYLAAERTTQVDLEIVREDTVQEDLIRAQVKAGTAAKLDIATAQVTTAQARLAVVRAQGAELSAQAAFANALGVDAGYNIQPIDDAPVFTNSPVTTIPIQTYDVAMKRAIALRPDYDSAVQNLVSSEYALKEARLTDFPSLSGNGSTSTGSTNYGGGAFRNTSNVGATLTIPLFDQGLRAANSAEAKSNLEIAQANLTTVLLGVQLSVKQALTNLVSASAAFDQTQVEYATALTVLQGTQAQYKAGVTTLPLLLNAQVGLTQASVDRVNAVYALRQAEQAYLYALGSNYDTSKMKRY